MIPPELPVSTVVVCEANKTRADLFGLWLDEYEVRRALTTAQFDEAVDAGVAVLVLVDSFGDGDAASVRERARSAASHCRVLGIRQQPSDSPGSGYDRELERPVFEDDLIASVETLSYRANYHLLLDMYYRTTALLSTYEWRADDDPDDEDRYERLIDRADRLQEYLNGLRPRMSDADIRAVAESFAAPDVAEDDAEPSPESKYRPDACAQCGQDWNESVDGGDAAAKLGAYVWRCRNCGHVDMRADPNHRHVSSFRR